MVAPFARIVVFCIACAVGYGIVHDEITAHLCVEYFTVGHVSLPGLHDPTVLGLVWGVLATWWVGLALGVPLGILCRLGTWPRLTVREVRGPVLLLAGAVGVTSLLAGLLAYAGGRNGTLLLPYMWAARVPASHQAAYLADLWAHQNAYNVGTCGGLVVCAWAWRERARRAGAPLLSRWTPWWLSARRLLWHPAARPSALARILAVLALLVMVLGSFGLAAGGFTANGDYESAIFTAVFGWPIVLGLFWLLGTATLLAMRQPRAAGAFVVLCVVLGLVGGGLLLGIASDLGLSALEAFLVLDTALIVVAWRLVLRRRRAGPARLSG